MSLPRIWLFVFWLLGSVHLAGCVSFPEAPNVSTQPRLVDGAFYSIDGARLGVSTWPVNEPAAVIIAVHGMNDYSNAFKRAGEWWAANHNFAVYAYDQRGFGRSVDVGFWPGSKTLKADLRAFIEAVRYQHVDTPVFVLGHSMGAAVILSAMADDNLPVDGAILLAPAVWGGSQMPILYRVSANIAATFAPGKTLTGERAGRQASDNIEALRALGADPLVIKETRTKAILGATRIMGEAWRASKKTGGVVFVGIGEKDEIIPVKSQRKAARRLCGDVLVKQYENGWHLLLRDLQAQTVWNDIAMWVAQKGAAGTRELRTGPAAQGCSAE